MKKNQAKIWMPRPQRPVLRFTPTAWAKLLYLRDAGPTEIGGFGVSTVDDLLLVEEFRLVRQTCTTTHVEFDDDAVADFFDQQVDAGKTPECFARIWLHTHPASSAEPSRIDEETFARVFGDCQWAVMFILARGGQFFARLRCNVGPGAEVKLPVEVDYHCAFNGSDEVAWQLEHAECVRERPAGILADPLPTNSQSKSDWYDFWDSYVNQYQSSEEITYDDFDHF